MTLKDLGRAVNKRKVLVTVTTVTFFLLAALGSILFLPSFRLKAVIMFLGLILGLGIGAVIAFFLELRDPSLGSIAELEEALGIPVLGVIPYWSKGSVSTNDLFALFSPGSVVARAFRALRTNLILNNKKDGVKSILISSAVPQEGRSMVAANLALTMAQHGKKTLLVGTVPGPRDVASLFGLEPTAGFVDILDGSYPWRDVVKTVADMILGSLGLDRAPETPGLNRLHVITGGHRPKDGAGSTIPSPMKAFLKEIKNEYDFIIFDGPPVDQKKEPLLTEKEMDGVIFIARLGQVSKRQIKRAVRWTSNGGGRCKGIVLNGMRPTLHPEFRENTGSIPHPSPPRGMMWAILFAIFGAAMGFYMATDRDSLEQGSFIPRPEGAKPPAAVEPRAPGETKPIAEPLEEDSLETAPTEQERRLLVEEAPQIAPLLPESDAQSDDEVKVEERPSYPYSLYLGSYRTVGQADRVAQTIKEKGFSAYRVKVNLGEMGTWYRVFAGCFRTVGEAKSAKRALD